MYAQALIHGLNRHYYSLLINYRKNELEERMLLYLCKKGWAAGASPLPSAMCVRKSLLRGLLKSCWCLK